MLWNWDFDQTDETFGGYPLCAVVTVLSGNESTFKTELRYGTAIHLARSTWKNNQPLDEVWVVNQKLGTRRDIISREVSDAAIQE